MRLECPDGCHNYDTIGTQATGTALDVEEFLHPHVSPEPGLRQHKAIRPDELERNAVCNNGGVALCDVREWSAMNQHGGALEGLHQCGLHAILHEHCHGTCTPNILRRDVLASLALCNHNLPNALPEVLQVRCKGQDGHAFTGYSDIVSGFPGNALLRWPLSNCDLPQITVVGVHNSTPCDCVWVNVQACKPALLLLRQVKGVRLGDAKLGKALQHWRGEVARTAIVSG
mmetsp:Transcript_2985/g.5664  ORF Transcript_2985/g.5664 Transcript_2985/m.5664 type:complete len:229 (+) Transcript_2985:1219-1905(+)